MSGLGKLMENPRSFIKKPDNSQEGNAEIYNEAFIDEAFKIQSSKLQLSGKPDWECRHYLHRKSLARGLRLYLIEMEMRSYNQTWTFPVYSAYDDSAYSAQLLIIEQYWIKVIKTTNFKSQGLVI